MKQHHKIFSELNNGQVKVRGYIQLRYNIFTVKVLQILQDHGFISHWCLKEKSSNSDNNLYLLVYYKREVFNTSSVTVTPFYIKGVSTKKRPAFVKANELWRLDKGLNIYILSTSRGIITDRQARKWNVGGKIICLVKN